MSTGLELLFIEAQPGRWYWIQQSGWCPVQCWDWMEEDPMVVGPFPSEDAAYTHHSRHQANAGGHSVQPYDKEACETGRIKNALARAIPPHEF